MAKVVDDAVWAQKRHAETIRGYLDGKTWRLVPGEDFDGSRDLHAARIYSIAKSDGVKVRIHREKDGALLVKAEKPNRPRKRGK